MPLVVNHGLGFQDSTRLHLSKSKSDFPYSSLLNSDSRLKHSQPLSLSLINWSFLSVLYSLRSLVFLVISKSLFFILKQTNPFTPLHQNLSSFFTLSSCWLLLPRPHTPLDTTTSLCFHFPPWVFSTSQLPSLGSGKVSSFFIPLFLYFVFVIWVYHFVSALSVIC